MSDVLDAPADPQFPCGTVIDVTTEPARPAGLRDSVVRIISELAARSNAAEITGILVVCTADGLPPLAVFDRAPDGRGAGDMVLHSELLRDRLKAGLLGS